VTVEYATAPKLAVNAFSYVSNTEACVYLSNDLFEWGYPNTPEEAKTVTDAVSITPQAAVRSFNKYQTPYEGANICPEK